MSSDPDVYPYDTIAYITTTVGNETLQGSGVLISPDEVLTASHVVYSATGGAASNITVSLGYNQGTAAVGTVSAANFHYNAVQDGGDTLTNQQSQYDYAVIHLARPFTGVGTMGLMSNFGGGAVNISGYPTTLDGQQETSQQTVTEQTGYTVFNGTSIGSGSSGGPVWITGGDGQPYVTGLVSTGVAGVGSQGYFTQISTAAFNQIEAWVAQDDGSGVGRTSDTSAIVVDTTTGQELAPMASPYTGPIQGLTNQFIAVTSDSLNITATSPGWFIQGGTGMNSLTASSGTNVLDGGTASSFMTGGSGTDTFYGDARTTAASFWDTVNNFHTGDAATIWGITQAGFTLTWANDQGAASHLGLTLHASATTGQNTALTLVGFSQADLQDGRLSVSFGTTGGNAYMHLAATA